MSYNALQKETTERTKRQQVILRNIMLRQYSQARIDIIKELDKVYATILKDIDPKDFITAINKANKLSKLLDTATRIYNVYAENAN